MLWFTLAFEICFTQCGVKDLHLPHEPLMVITNPPWGHRLAKGLNGRDEQDRTTSADTELQEVRLG